MYAVVINEGPAMADDNATYYCTEKPVYVLVHFENEEGAMKFARFVAFTPTNGRNKGRLHQVPLERVVSVVNP